MPGIHPLALVSGETKYAGAQAIVRGTCFGGVSVITTINGGLIDKPFALYVSKMRCTSSVVADR
jgi:hypothetical protein